MPARCPTTALFVCWPVGCGVAWRGTFLGVVAPHESHARGDQDRGQDQADHHHPGEQVRRHWSAAPRYVDWAAHVERVVGGVRRRFVVSNGFVRRHFSGRLVVRQPSRGVVGRRGTRVVVRLHPAMLGGTYGHPPQRVRRE